MASQNIFYLKYHFIKRMVHKQEIELNYCSTHNQLVDVCYKSIVLKTWRQSCESSQHPRGEWFNGDVDEGRRQISSPLLHVFYIAQVSTSFLTFELWLFLL